MSDDLQFTSTQKDDYVFERAFADDLLIELYSPKHHAEVAEETQWFWEVERMATNHTNRHGYAPDRPAALAAIAVARREIATSPKF